MRFASSLVSAAVTFALLLGACSKEEPEESSYFDRTISPILTTSCVRAPTGSGCHVATPKGNAFGNLDLSNFDGVDHRRDLLAQYGPYGQPALLVKNVPNFQLEIAAFDGQKALVTTDIKHAGGPILEPTATGYQTLRRWILNGATKNNSGIRPASAARLACSNFVPTATGFDSGTDPGRDDFATFRNQVIGVFRGSCAAGNCHGTLANDLYLTCGNTPEQVRWNYFAASQYLATAAEQSEITRRPLAPSQGGAFHEGGVIFDNVSNPEYAALVDWARKHGPPDFGTIDPNLAFFAHRVQPMLVKKGCMMLQCHSAAQFHDYRLHGGAGGSFSLSATTRNYALSLAQLSVESEDVNASRIVRKNLYRPEVWAGSPGIAHRGGPLLEDFPQDLATGKACDDLAPDYENGDLDKIPAYCVIREWHRRERDARKPAPLSGILYVKRNIPAGANRPQDFDVYSPGAELRLRKASIDAEGRLTADAGDASLNGLCGLDKNTADIRRPAVSWDGRRIAFAARTSAGEPLQIYEAAADGSGCQKHAAINNTGQQQNGILIHNFDPAYSPPDLAGGTHLVFASTRGNLNGDAFDYSGPQRTPANPAKPNANLYELGPDGQVRQLTYLLNMERQPSFMQDGRVIFTAEKRAQGFYQLALRRMNLDGGDYHPLFAQRGSIGFHEATSVVELADKNFAAIFSEPNFPHGGGVLGVFNRSLGIDFQSTNPSDYPIDKSVLDPASPASPEPSFFLHSLRVIGGGVFSSPATLPGGQVLVSFAPGEPATFNGDYDVYVMDPVQGGAPTKLFGDGGSAEVEAVAVYGRGARGIFASSFDEPNAFTTILPGKAEADVHVLDMPVLSSLLFQNTPTGRPIESGLSSFEIYEELPPPLDMTSFSGSNVATDEFGQVFVKRRRLGQVPLNEDGSAHFQVPGGVPISIKLPETEESRKHGYPRFQRESMVFSPGEYAHQSFRRTFFNGLCGNCHGSLSGRPLDVAVQPDILTQASDTQARDTAPALLNGPPSARGQAEGP